MSYCVQPGMNVRQQGFTFLANLASEDDLAAASLALGARSVKGWSEAEAKLALDCPDIDSG